MKKALASLVVIVFAGLLCTSLLTIFTGHSVNSENSGSKVLKYPYYASY